MENKTYRFDAVFTMNENIKREREFIDSFKEFLDLWQAKLELYDLEELRSIDEVLGL